MTSYVWNAQEIRKLQYGEVHGHWKTKGLSIDSRSIENCELFVAFKGKSVDGHDYINEALDKGASAFIANFIPHNIDTSNLHCWIVDDVQKAIEMLAVHNRKRSKAKIIAVTGSVGKTSVTHSISSTLKNFGPTFQTQGNFNNEIGLPLCLASMPLDTKYGIFELGMRGFGQISHLTRFVMPHISVITKIAPAHIEILGSLENIARAKSEIFENNSDGGVAIINGDGEYAGIMRGIADDNGLKNIISFGEGEDNDVCLLSYEQSERSKIAVNLFGDKIDYQMKARGKHRALNSLITLSIVKILDLDLKRSLKIIGEISELKGRGEKTVINLDNKKFTLIDESYNSSPESLRSSLHVLEDFESGNKSARKIALLSDMLELGDVAELEHKNIGAMISENNKIDKIYAFGILSESLFNELEEKNQGKFFASLAEMKLEIENLIQDGDIILVKGSFGTKIHELVELFKRKNCVL